jgi:hypothetical protein
VRRVGRLPSDPFSERRGPCKQRAASVARALCATRQERRPDSRTTLTRPVRPRPRTASSSWGINRLPTQPSRSRFTAVVVDEADPRNHDGFPLPDERRYVLPEEAVLDRRPPQKRIVETESLDRPTGGQPSVTPVPHDKNRAWRTGRPSGFRQSATEIGIASWAPGKFTGRPCGRRSSTWASRLRITSGSVPIGYLVCTIRLPGPVSWAWLASLPMP